MWRCRWWRGSGAREKFPAQNLPHRPDQGITGKGFAQQAGVFIRRVAIGTAVAAVAGGQQYLEVGAACPDLGQELPTRHARKADVREHEIKAGGVFQQFQRCGAVAGLQNGAAEILKCFRDEHADQFVILHHQDRLVSGH